MSPMVDPRAVFDKEEGDEAASTVDGRSRERREAVKGSIRGRMTCV